MSDRRQVGTVDHLSM